MCGIFGILSDRPAADAILRSLKLLEYRGYDSAGVATLVDGEIVRRRAVGKLSALDRLLEAQPIGGTVGIGHTRWATHGAPTVANAHPHATARVAVVHNGIIENFRELRDELVDEHGCNFESDTDTETIVHLASLHLADGLSPFDAAMATLRRLKGAFALAFIFRGATDLIVAARRGSPLAVGWGDKEMFVGSDALALAPFTNRVTYLEEGDVAAVTRSGARIFDESGAAVVRAEVATPASASQVDKGAHKHFMAKEIHEQPTAARTFLSRYLTADHRQFVAPIPNFSMADLDSFSITGCGTAFYAGAVAQYWFEELADAPCSVDIASEKRYRAAPMAARHGAIFVSQSGETADTLAALRHCKAHGQRTIAVVNVATSSMAREADVALPILAGVEIGVASTKAFVCQLLTLGALAAMTARARGRLDAEGEAELIAALTRLPALLEAALGAERTLADIAAEVAKHHDVLYLGRGPLYPLALEGALKLKEISYLHAEGYAAGELKHGPIALISDQVPVIVLAPTDRWFEKTVSNMQEVMARGGKVVLITDAAGARAAGQGVWKTVVMPSVDPFWAPILYAAPVQLLAYHAALALGTDVDQPRNLAKSVTVE